MVGDIPIEPMILPAARYDNVVQVGFTLDPEQLTRLGHSIERRATALLAEYDRALAANPQDAARIRAAYTERIDAENWLPASMLKAIAADHKPILKREHFKFFMSLDKPFETKGIKP